jgi:tRNA(Ile)-lysidine synthase
LKGMPYRVILPVFDAEIPLVRPLLGWWRADTEEYCRQNGLSPIYDPTNADTAYFRNRLRHELIPQLESYNPRVRQALVHTALALQGDDELLAEVLRAAWQRSVLEQGSGYIAFDKGILESLPSALRRNLFRRAAFELRPGLRDVDFDALERAASLKQVDLAGGLSVHTEGQKIYLAAWQADLPSAQWPQLREQFSVSSGQYPLENNWVLAFEQFPLKTEDWNLNTDPWSAWLDADLAQRGLTVRTMQAGDRFRPLGLDGKSVKLQDFFVNLKVPKRARERWPLVCVGDEIAWVAGLRLAHTFRVTGETKQVLCLQLKRLP